MNQTTIGTYKKQSFIWCDDQLIVQEAGMPDLVYYNYISLAEALDWYAHLIAA